MALNNAPSWKVTQVEPRTSFDPANGPVEGFRVSFQTVSGVAGYVFVQAARIGNRDAVAAAIQTAVEQLHAVHTLTG